MPGVKVSISPERMSALSSAGLEGNADICMMRIHYYAAPSAVNLRRRPKIPTSVIPAKAGIQGWGFPARNA